MRAEARPSPPAPGARRRRRLEFSLLGLLSAFGPLSMDLYLPALPQIGTDLRAGPAQVQLTVSACLIGLAAGQAVAGPVSDQLGRRTPLLVGLAGFIAASVGCAGAPWIWVLIAFRLLQGLAGAFGLAISRAIVRDRYPDREVARVFSLLMLVQGAVPIVAPVIGGGLLKVAPWRALFFLLAAVGAVILVLVAWALPESLSVTHRHRGGLRTMAAHSRAVVHDRRFVGGTCAMAIGGVSLYAYIELSSFVLQDEFALSAARFAMLFAANSVGIMLAGRLSAALVGRAGSVLLIGAALAVMCAAAGVLLAATISGWGLWGVLPALLFVIAPIGLLFPNATAVALSRHRTRAGTASAMLGLAQYGVGAVAGPLASLGGVGARNMATTMFATSCVALIVFGAVLHPGRPHRVSAQPTVSART